LVLRQYEGYNIDPSCYFATDRYRNTGSPTPVTTSNLPLPTKIILPGWRKLQYFSEPPVSGAWNKLRYEDE